MDSTVFWCTPCKKYHAGECSDTVPIIGKIRLALDTELTSMNGYRSKYAKLIMDSKAEIIIGSRRYKAMSYDKKADFVYIDFVEVNAVK